MGELIGKEGGKTKSAGYGGGALSGAAAAGAFFGTAIILTVAAYMFGTLMGIAPEFPMLFSYTFLLSTLLAVVLMPVAGVLVRLYTAPPASPMSSLMRGSAGGVLLAALIWLATVGAGANPLDWPNLLNFLQLGTSWAIAGAVLATGISYWQLAGGEKERLEWMTSAAKQLLSFLLISVLLIPLPFLPLWLAKRSFGMRAAAEASEKIEIPAGINLVVKDEDVPGDSFETNRRYQAGGKWESGGSDFTLAVDGERHGYVVEIINLHGSIKDPAGTGNTPVDWQAATAQSVTVAVIMQTAREHFPVPLRYEKATAGPDRAVYLRGDDLTVVARPLDPSRQDTGVLFSFSVPAP